MTDEFRTIDGTSEGTYSELRSKFLAFAHHVTTVDEAMQIVSMYQKEYYDARHVCWAYMLGADRLTFRSNDNGEPSGTAGKPILGQINSNDLTDIVIIVVRYFGGVKLGTSGLISAYRTAASEAIANAKVVERTVDIEHTFGFEYPFMTSAHSTRSVPSTARSASCFWKRRNRRSCAGTRNRAARTRSPSRARRCRMPSERRSRSCSRCATAPIIL